MGRADPRLPVYVKNCASSTRSSQIATGYLIKQRGPLHNLGEYYKQLAIMQRMHYST